MGFSRENKIKSVRKERPCESCGASIIKGSPAVGWVGVSHGDFASVTFHPDCRKAEVALNELHENYYEDDWMNLSADLEWEDWPWLIEKFPTVAARMNVTCERYQRIVEHHERTRRAFLKIAIREQRP